MLNAINYFGGHSPTFIIEPSNKKYSKYRVEFHPISLNADSIRHDRGYGWSDGDSESRSKIPTFKAENITKKLTITGGINPFTTYLNKFLETTFENSVLPENAIKALDLMASGGISFIMYDEEGNNVIQSNSKKLTYANVIINSLNTELSHFEHALNSKQVKFTMNLTVLPSAKASKNRILSEVDENQIKELLGVKI